MNTRDKYHEFINNWLDKLSSKERGRKEINNADFGAQKEVSKHYISNN